METGIIALLVGFFALSGCASPVAPTVGHTDLRPTGCHAKAVYDREIEAYAEREDMGPEWVSFMESEYEHYCEAQHIGEYYRDRGTPIALAMTYWKGQEDARWVGKEDTHAAAIQELLELTYPSLRIEVTYGVSDNADIQLVLRHPGNSWGNSQMIAVGDYDGIIVHEFGHFLGLHHHYDTLQEIGHDEHMAPGDEKCLMDRTSQELDTACRFALGLPARESHAEDISSLVDWVNGNP